MFPAAVVRDGHVIVLALDTALTLIRVGASAGLCVLLNLDTQATRITAAVVIGFGPHGFVSSQKRIKRDSESARFAPGSALAFDVGIINI